MSIPAPRCSCIVCHEEKSSKGIHSHYITSHTESGYSDCCLRNSIRRNHPKRWEENKVKSDYALTPLNCYGCGIVLPYKKRNNKFCSHSCAAIHTPRDTIKSRYGPPKGCKGTSRKRYSKISFCVICNKIIHNKHIKTCSTECYSSLLKKIAINNPHIGNKRSKDEIMLYEMCKTKFTNMSANEKLFNGWDADILLHDFKLAILWNGPWHYKEMNFGNHSLKQVQNRDLIKIREITKADWKYIIFEDRYYTPKSTFNYILVQLGIKQR